MHSLDYPSSAQCAKTDNDDDYRSLELAIDLAWDASRIGGGIIPTGPDYTPRLAYDKATRDPEVIAAYIHDGYGISVVGAGLLLALDLEHPSKKGTDGDASIADAAEALGQLPRTRATRTKNGGRHLLFTMPPGLKIRPAQEMLRGCGVAIPGVDVVTGAIRLPPTRGYTVACDAPIAELPIMWARALSDPPERHEERVVVASPDKAMATLMREAERVAALGSGRSAALNAIAYTFALDVDETTLVRVLLAAAEQNGTVAKRGRRGALSSIKGGIRARRLKAGAA